MEDLSKDYICRFDWKYISQQSDCVFKNKDIELIEELMNSNVPIKYSLKNINIY